MSKINGTHPKRARILVADAIAEAGLEKLRAAADVTFQPDITADQLKATIGQYDGLVVRSRTRVPADVIAIASNLRVIGRAGVGLDSIDLAAAEAHGVTVVNTPFASTIAVAEFTFGLLLALARPIAAADDSMKEGEWLKKQMMGGELAGKTLGVIGAGRIGRAVIERAAAFSMRILTLDPDVTDAEIRAYGGEPTTLSQLLAQSDFVSLHTPLTNATRNLLDADAIAGMKDGARLVCCARGCIINEEALIDALDSGKLAGAALDVFATEPPGATQLVRHPKVIATPHIGAMTREAQEKAAIDVAEKVLSEVLSPQLSLTRQL